MEVFNARTLLDVLTDDDERELMQHLPEVDRTPQGLREFLQSPQFQQALRAFNSAVVHGHMHNILQQLGTDPNQLTPSDSATAAFLRTLQKQLENKKP